MEVFRIELHCFDGEMTKNLTTKKPNRMCCYRRITKAHLKMQIVTVPSEKGNR